MFEEDLPSGPSTAVLKNDRFIARFDWALSRGETVKRRLLQRDSAGTPAERERCAADVLAQVLRSQNGRPNSTRMATLLPARWSVEDDVAHVTLIGQARGHTLEEEWRAQGGGYSPVKYAATAGKTSAYLSELLGCEVQVEPLFDDAAHPDHLAYHDALTSFVQGERFYERGVYPTVDDVLSAGSQSVSVVGSQSDYARKSPYFSCVVCTRNPGDAPDFRALSVAFKAMYRATGALMVPKAVVPTQDGRWELHIEGRCDRAPKSEARRIVLGSTVASASEALADPISHYLDMEIVEFNLFEETMAHPQDMVEAERIADDVEGLGLPEPEDFAIKTEAQLIQEREAYERHESLQGEPTGEEELDALIGLESAKRTIREIVQCAAARKQAGKRMPSLHICFMGNPGTGKTTVARTLGHMLYDAGVLPKRNVFVETDGAGVEVFGPVPDYRRARHGVLFIDEAYGLANRSSNVLARLVKEMEDCRRNFDRDGFVCVFAGYPEQTKRMISLNPGLRDRIGFFVELEDYDADTMTAILQKELSIDGYSLNAAAHELMSRRMASVVNRRDANFANGRLARKIAERCEMRQSTLHGTSCEIGVDVVESVFSDEFADLVGERRRDLNRESVDLGNGVVSVNTNASGNELTGDQELARLVGLDDVKRQLTEYADFAAVAKERGEKMPSLHLCLEGNPGTGKTILARTFGHMLYDRGLMANRDLFVESDRASLIAGYAGQTALKTNRLVDSARGGVLFIDEAYALALDERDAFGKEALAVLVKRMEDCRTNFERDGFVCVMAGYSQPMEQMLSVNPGLRDRFGLTVQMPDYRPDELGQMLDLYVHEHHYRLTEAARRDLRQAIAGAQRGRDFSNGRLVRKLFDRCRVKQASMHDAKDSIGVDVVREVLSEPDIKRMLQPGSGERRIGFIA